MSETRGRGELRRARRRQQVRRTAVLLGVLLLLATAFAVWLAVDAQGPVSGEDVMLGSRALQGG